MGGVYDQCHDYALGLAGFAIVVLCALVLTAGRISPQAVLARDGQSMLAAAGIPT